MMQVWIVWSSKPIAVFSSEERARNYIARKDATNTWTCSAAHINPEGVEEPSRRARARNTSAYVSACC